MERCAAPLSVLRPDWRGRKLGAAGTRGKPTSRGAAGKERESAETSDAPGPGGAPELGGGHSQPAAASSSPSPPPGQVRELPLCSHHEPGVRSTTLRNFGLRCSSGCLARAPRGSRTRGDGGRCARLGVRGRRASVPGPLRVPGALGIPQVMGAGPAQAATFSAPPLRSPPASARSNPGAPLRPEPVLSSCRRYIDCRGRQRGWPAADWACR